MIDVRIDDALPNRDTDDYMAYQGEPADIYYTIEPDSWWLSYYTRYVVDLVIKDQSGITVRMVRLAGGLGPKHTSWDGKKDDGSWAPPGTYTATIKLTIPSKGRWYSQAHSITVVHVKMLLEKVGDTWIERQNNYSENTTIKVTAVNAATGQACTWFKGVVNIAEDTSDPDYVPIYNQNGGYLPSSITFTASDNGVKTFVAKSLAGPKVEGYVGPDPARILTTNYGVYNQGGYLIVPQWTDDLGQVDPRAAGDVIDWFEARTKAIFENASGEAAEVLSKISWYDQAWYGSGRKGKAHASWGQECSPVSLNPCWSETRLNIPDIDYPYQCQVILGPDHTHTILHEARHCYQAWLTSWNTGLGIDDLPYVSPDNDEDGDGLVDEVPIAPCSYLLDTTDLREKCSGQVSFSGDTNRDNIRKDATWEWDEVPKRDAEEFAARFYNNLP